MKKHLAILLVVFSLTVAHSVYAQPLCDKLKFITYSQGSFSPDRTIPNMRTIQEINATQLRAKLQADRMNSKTMQLQVIVSSSTGCAGTIYALIYINKLKAIYGDKVHIYFIIGDVHKECRGFYGVTSDLAPDINVYAVENSYIDKRDAREGSDRLTKELFPESKEDIIGTPKYLIINAKTGGLLFHGMRNYKNSYPENLIEYFMDEITK